IRLYRDQSRNRRSVRRGAVDPESRAAEARTPYRTDDVRPRTAAAAGAIEHDPEKWTPVFPRDKRGTRLRGDHALVIGGRLRSMISAAPFASSSSPTARP